MRGKSTTTRRSFKIGIFQYIRNKFVQFLLSHFPTLFRNFTLDSWQRFVESRHASSNRSSFFTCWLLVARIHRLLFLSPPLSHPVSVFILLFRQPALAHPCYLLITGMFAPGALSEHRDFARTNNAPVLCACQPTTAYAFSFLASAISRASPVHLLNHQLSLRVDATRITGSREIVRFVDRQRRFLLRTVEARSSGAVLNLSIRLDTDRCFKRHSMFRRDFLPVCWKVCGIMKFLFRAGNFTSC